jgi:glycosyltransferase involved in cell wall biosynthesis
MSLTVALTARTLSYPHGGGHFWVYLNWALGLRAQGCRIVWIEPVRCAPDPPHDLQERVDLLKERLDRYRAVDAIAITTGEGTRVPGPTPAGCVDVDVVGDVDVFLNIAYQRKPAGVRCRRSVLIDIDPGLTQVWMSAGQLPLDPHDLYYTIGETVGTDGALFPDCGLDWHHTPPPVNLASWSPSQPGADPAFTTITHWSEKDFVWNGRAYANGKRAGFWPFLDLPATTGQPLELAVSLMDDDDERDRATLVERGWRLKNPHVVASKPWNYHDYVQHSLGEFSCAKPSCLLLQNAWISDRTLCYLASGKPAIVQHTGPSRFLPDAEGLFRFRDNADAVSALRTVAADYDRQCQRARALAEEYFDGEKVVRRVLERAVN